MAKLTKNGKKLGRTQIAALAVLLFGAVGFILIQTSSAATYVTAVEAENGVISGNAKAAAGSGASNGNAISFGQGGGTSCTPGSGPLREDKQFTGTITKVNVPFSVTLPDNYYKDCKEYPIVYGLHGIEENNKSFMNQTISIRNAIKDGAIEDYILVTPDSCYDGWWDNSKCKAEDNLIQELIPYMEANYRVKKGASYRLLYGFSMGGAGAFRLAVKYPKMWAATYTVDAAFESADKYDDWYDNAKTYNPPITMVAGPLSSWNETVINRYKAQGVTFPYKKYPSLSHDIAQFVSADKQDGSPAMKFLQSNLGRNVPQ